jgi:hypothetical protein
VRRELQITSLCHRQSGVNRTFRAFAQILGKLHFVQLDENLRRILVDYAKKRSRPANTTFNAAC